MTTDNAPDAARKQRRLVPACCLLAGVGYVVIFLIRHDPWAALAGFLVMICYGLILVRSETAALLRGELTDERRRGINRRASALNLNVVVALGGFVISRCKATTATRGR